MADIVGRFSRKTKEREKEINYILDISSSSRKNTEIVEEGPLTVGFTSEKNTPIFTEDREICAFFNGVVYNGKELKEKISEKHRFSTESNEELLIHLYEEIGENCFKFAEGEFAVVIWDKKKGKLIFFKTLPNHTNIFYYITGENIFFSSEIKSLLSHPDVERNPNLKSIKNFLIFRHIPSPNTFFEGVKRLNPYEVLTISNDKIKSKKINFLDPENIPKYHGKKPLKIVYETLKNSMKSRFERAENFGLYLSGGLDSTTLLYFLDKLSDNPVKTYTVALDKDGPYANKVSKYFGTNHKEFKFDGKDLLNIVPKFLWHSEYPIAHAGFFQYYLPSISDKSEYIFWGQGSEEVFFGRKDYTILNNITQIKKIFPNKSFKYITKKIPPISNKTQLHKFLNICLSTRPEDYYVSLREIYTKKERKELFSKKIRNLDYKVQKVEESSSDLLKKYAQLTLKNGFLSDRFPERGQTLVNPYLDKNLVSLMFNFPSKYKISSGPRCLLRKIMKNKIPDFVRKRRRDSWRDQTESIVNENKGTMIHFIKRLEKRNIFKSNLSLEKFLRKYNFRLDEKLWALLSVEIMFEIFLDNFYEKEPPSLNKLL